MSETSRDDTQRRVSPQQRQVILNEQIHAMTAAGYHLVKTFGHLAVLEREGSARIEIFIDGYGQVRHA